MTGEEIINKITELNLLQCEIVVIRSEYQSSNGVGMKITDINSYTDPTSSGRLGAIDLELEIIEVVDQLGYTHKVKNPKFSREIIYCKTS